MRAGTPMMASSGYVAELDRELCTKCGDCVEACPFEALAQNGDGVMHDWERCLGCGVCEATCKTGAITLERDERKGIPLDVRTLA